MGASEMYAFKFQNVKAMRYLWLMAIGMALALLSLDKVPLLICMLLLFGSLIVSAYLMVKHIKAEDSICLYPDYFDSAYFGRVPYADIIRASSPAAWPKPSLKLKLRSGKTILWVCNSESNIASSKADALTLAGFILKLGEKIEEAAKRHSSPGLANTDKAEFVLTTPPEKQRKKEEATVATQLKSLDPMQAIKRNAKWALPVGSLLLLTTIFKTCGKSWVARRQEQQAQLLPRAFAASEKTFQDLVSQSKEMISQRTTRAHPYFLYTNDSLAFLQYIPDLNVEDGPIPAMSHLNAIDSLREFVAHPDNYFWTLYLMRGDEQTVNLSAQENWADTAKIGHGDTTIPVIYVAAYDKTMSVPSQRWKWNAGQNKLLGSDDSVGFSAAFPVQLKDTADARKIRAAMANAVPGIKILLAQAHQRPGSFKLYLAAHQNTAMSQLLFMKSVTVFKEILREVQVDTMTFRLKIYPQ